MKKNLSSFCLILFSQFIINCETIPSKCLENDCVEKSDLQVTPDSIAEIREGFHTTYYQNGDWFEGYYKQGKRNGPGKYFFQSKNCLEGEWKEDLLQGKATIRNQKGSIVLEGIWLNNEYKGLFNPYSELEQDKAN